MAAFRFAPTANGGVIWVPSKFVRFGASGQLPMVVSAPATLKMKLPLASEFDAAHQDGEDVHVRFVGDFRPGDREFMEELGVADRVELIDYVPRRRSLELQRESDALLLLIPEAGGRGRGVLSGKVFEYIAAERPILAVVPPDGAAARLIAETGAGVVAAPEDVDAMRDALVAMHARWRAGELDGAPLAPEWRAKLSRGRRVEQLADLLRSIA